MRRKKVKRLDPLSPEERSLRMSMVKSKNTRSTELHVAARLVRFGFRGWRRHPHEIPGKPDFYFVRERLALFVDGCFWHGCPLCKRNMPRIRREFWAAKIESNQNRDAAVRKLLTASGIRLLRIWEHELRDGAWLARLQKNLRI